MYSHIGGIFNISSNRSRGRDDLTVIKVKDQIILFLDGHARICITKKFLVLRELFSYWWYNITFKIYPNGLQGNDEYSSLDQLEFETLHGGNTLWKGLR